MATFSVYRNNFRIRLSRRIDSDLSCDGIFGRSYLLLQCLADSLDSITVVIVLNLSRRSLLPGWVPTIIYSFVIICDFWSFGIMIRWSMDDTMWSKAFFYDLNLDFFVGVAVPNLSRDPLLYGLQLFASCLVSMMIDSWSLWMMFFWSFIDDKLTTRQLLKNVSLVSL